MTDTSPDTPATHEPRPSTTLPAESYHTAEQFTRERENVFNAAWLCVGHRQEIPNHGDTTVFRILNHSVLLVHGADAQIRAFHNVCRHRAGPLVWEDSVPQSGLKTLRCRYHGWRYGLDGRLQTARDFGATLPEGLDLMSIPLREWSGLLFVWLGAQPPASFDTWISPLDEIIGNNLLNLSLHSREQHSLRCNWKVYAENYLEGYHIPWMHPTLSREVELSSYLVEPGERWVRHRVDTSGQGPNRGLWVWWWPSLALNIYGDGASVERIVPISPTETRVDYLYLFQNNQNTDVDTTLAMSRRVTNEDIRICEAVQRGLESGAVRTGLLSPRHEAGVAYFQALIRDTAAPETR